jgi:D-alanyl-D-alanine carboxypeptidase (penicillin-binding protein 5/6)
MMRRRAAWLMIAVWVAGMVLRSWPCDAAAAQPPSQSGQTGAEPRVSAAAAVLIDWSSGIVLFEKQAFQRRAPASTTKIMTGMLVAELGRPDEIVTVSRRAASTPGSSAGIRAGDRLTLDEVFHGMMLSSGNDACVAAAEHLAGSEPEFVKLMNAKARAIGALATNFVNSHGLTTPNHYTTAFDLALMARWALRNRAFARAVSTQEREVRPELAGSLRTSWLRNTNRLLWTFEGADGVKTGTTDAAGKCLVASATRDGRRLLAVVLNSGDRWGDAARLLAYGFEQFESVTVVRAGQVVRTVTVRDGMTRRLPLLAAADLIVPVRRGHAADIRLSVEAAPRPQAEVREGTVLGRASLIDGQRTLLTVNLVAATTVQRWTIGRVLLNRIVLPLVRLLARLGVG